MADEARALVVRELGSWDGVRLETVPVPVPGPGEVLIRAEAAAVNFPDILIVEGRYQHKPALPFTPGRDVAGVVLAVGDGVAGVRPGQRVAAQPPWGCFATHVLASAEFVTPIPDGLTATAAAAAATVVATVVAALGMRARLQAGELLLVTGAAGGVGSAAVQYARHLGARVAALVSSAEKEAAVRALGAEIVLRSDQIGELARGLRAALQAHAPEGADVVIDVVGGDTFDGALRCVRPGGRLVIVGFAGGRIAAAPTNQLLLRDVTLIGSSLDRLFRDADATFMAMFATALEDVAAGRISVPIDSTYGLHDAHAAIARVAGRHAVGKVVLYPME